MIRTRTYPGADCGAACDHVPVVADLKLKLKKIKKGEYIKKEDWNALRASSEMKEKFQLQLRNKYDALGEQILDEGNAKSSWEKLRDALTEAANKVVL